MDFQTLRKNLSIMVTRGYSSGSILCGINYFLVLAFWFLTGNVFSQSISLKIDTDKNMQTIDGFGASDAWRCQFVGANWPQHKKERMAKWLFSKDFDTDGNPLGIGISLWRFYIGAGTAEQGDTSQIRNEWRRAESFIDNNETYDWSKQAGQQWFLKKAKAAGVEKFLAFSIAVPTFWSNTGTGYNKANKKFLNLKEEHYQDYADFMVEILDHFENEGIAFDYLSPINEPQWDWQKPSQEGTPATNENIAKLVGMLNDGIENKSLATEIVIPEAADLRFLYSNHGRAPRANQIESFFGESFKDDKSYVGNYAKVPRKVSGHSYFTTWPVDSLISIRKELNKSLGKHQIDFWQSEFCILENTEDIGKGQKRDLGIKTALYVARVIHADLTLANAKSWQWWTAITIADFKDGLIYLDTGDKNNMYNKESLKYDGEFHDSKLLWALGNYSRFVRPGMVRVPSVLLTEKSLKEQYLDVLVSAYKNPKNNQIVLVAINYSDEEKSIDLENENITIEKSYTTSEDKNLGFEAVENQKIYLQPRSITTLVGAINP
ncbi:glycoside hydrolase [Galbibacter mesophilus]|uniref:glycoside hydrolase n=1 Tax=Galbibacter mesophilus TaxID=379069 RepID=UPI00191DC76A|nr:glycoside hydrolase [Galbibacter mesophilus]MCM5664066.1 glycosyl hydrolase [Galbibacter mesophilus]